LSPGVGPVVPSEIEPEYAATIRSLPELVAACLSEPWDFASAVKLVGALLVAKGYPLEGHEVMQLRSVVDREDQTGRQDSGEIPW
jgi:hypothetical protein